jgi:CubicO group peptidase (beta-lactamase class C family)/signal transduction histidine kinase
MKSKKVFLFMLVMLGVVVFPLAVQENAEQGRFSEDLRKTISAEVKKIMDNGEIPGLSLVVINGNKQTFKNGFGYADLEKKIPVKTSTLFELCSCSKSFTALAILQLAEKGSVSLNDAVSRYFPWFYVRFKGRNYKITINQLLHHTSGIPWNTFSRIPQGNSKDALVETTRLIVGIELENIPGERVVYCNTNYDIIGAIIEKVSGMTFEEYMWENIFKPLGLLNTSVGQKRNDPDMAAGYKLVLYSPKKKFFPTYRGNTPSAYMVTNAVDMERFLKIQLGLIEIKPDLKKIIEESHKADYSSSKDSFSSQEYAKGWLVVDNGSELISSGANPNYSAYIALRPKNKMAVAVLANSSSSDTSNLGKNLLNLLLESESEKLLKFIKITASPAIIVLLLAFTFVGLIAHKNKGWGYLALGWLANLVYLQFESFNPKGTIIAAGISTITDIAFLSYCFSMLKDRWKWMKVSYASIIGCLFWIAIITIFHLYDKPILSNLFNPQFMDEHFLPLNLPVVIFSTISLILSALVLYNFLSKEKLANKFWLTIPWAGYGLIQFLYLYKNSPNKMIIYLAFILALFLKAVIAFGLFKIFKEQTEQAQIKKERFLHSKRQLLAFSWFSHELKTPVFALKTSALALLKRLQNREYSRATVNANKLIDLSRQLDSIVESVKIASEPIKVDELKYFSINDALDKALFSVKQIYFFRTSDIQKEFGPGLNVCGIEENFVQVFANIIRNAFEAIEERKEKSEPVKFKLRIDTRKVLKKNQKYVLVEIIDFGPGIPKDIIDNIFEAYISLKKGINRGLGLWVVREFVEMFGGFIEVDSPLEELKFGTQFRAYFPLVEDLKINPNFFWSKKIKQQWEEI